jgi:hypothetical protein
MFAPPAAKTQTKSLSATTEGRAQRPSTRDQAPPGLSAGWAHESARGEPVKNCALASTKVQAAPARPSRYLGKVPVFPPGSSQSELKVGAVDDPLEHEADRIAERVMHMPATKASTSGVPLSIQRLPERSKRFMDEAPASVARALASPGVALEPALRRDQEQRFGHDFSQVRVHTGAWADRSARDVHARAYALGHDIVFGAGQYVSSTFEGRLLIAHELAHVVQQGNGSTSIIQRAPDAGVSPDVVTQTSAALDPDANEAAARAQNPDLSQIDRGKQSPKENEDAVRAVVIEAFGGEKALNDAFESLSPSVIKEVDKYSSSDAAAMTANRVQFFVRMRLYFSSWAEVLDHFRNFVRVTRDPVDVVLHKSAAARLERALNVLQGKGHPFPSITVGFGLRGFHRGEFQTQGFMIHALGYAFDVAASENPKIGFLKPGEGPGRHDPIQIASSIDPSRAHMDMGNSSPGIIEAMGKRTAQDNALSAADDKDPVAKDYFERFEQQFQKMEEGSLEFIGTISKDHREKLLKLRQDYFLILKALADERKKGKRSDAKAIADLEAERRRLLAAIPALVTEWITAIDTAISKTLKAHPGMEKMRSPAAISKDLRSAEANVGQARKTEAQALATKATAMAARDAASQVRKQAEAREHRAPAGIEFKKALAATSAARQNLTDKIDAVVDAIEKQLDATRAREGATQARNVLTAELKTSSDPALRGAWDWITSLRELRQALSAPDLSTPAGLKAFEGLTTGDLQHIAPVNNPPLLRLLEKGIFNPQGAFDLEFFEEMAHSGFWPGATWAFGGADPMHFELLEGRNKIQAPGNFKLKN